MRLLLLFLFIFFLTPMIGQSLCDQGPGGFEVLHFTKTNGFDHNTRNNSNSLFEDLGALNGFTVVDTEDASIFDNLDSINTFAIIIFSNTSDKSNDPLFTAIQRENFEAYIAQGGSFIGIHAATDTYRTGWPFYNNLVGGIVQTNPNHTSNNHNNFMDHQLDHEILDGIPDPWQKTEEYYYWDLNGGMVDTANIATLLKVRNTGSNSYDHERPITWFRTFESGTRSFYTALGHANSNYTDPDNEFRLLLSNAVCWAAYDSDALELSSSPTVKLEDSHLIIKDGKSIVMKSPNGGCHQLTVDNAGQLKLVPIKCVE